MRLSILSIFIPFLLACGADGGDGGQARFCQHPESVGVTPGLGEECHFLLIPCAAGLTCLLEYSEDAGGSDATCQPYNGAGSGLLGEHCTDSSADWPVSAPDQCANGLHCASVWNLSTCEDANCCTPYCESDSDCPGDLFCDNPERVQSYSLSFRLQEYGDECLPRYCVDG